MSNSWLCVDANLVVRVVAAPCDESVWGHWKKWSSAGRRFAAPTLLYYEVTNALYRYQKAGWMSASAAELAQKAAFSLPISLFGDADLHRHALEMAVRLSLPTAYDAHYLALAEALGAEFWTADSRLVQAVGDVLPWVHGLRIE